MGSNHPEYRISDKVDLFSKHKVKEYIPAENQK